MPLPELHLELEALTPSDYSFKKPIISYFTVAEAASPLSRSATTVSHSH